MSEIVPDEMVQKHVAHLRAMLSEAKDELMQGQISGEQYGKQARYIRVQLAKYGVQL